MHSPALPLMWQFWAKHRIGLGLLLGFVGLSIFGGWMVRTETGTLSVVLVTSIIFALAVMYLMAVFSYGWDINVSSPLSGYPSWMFTLPVRTSYLVAWPMLYGVVSVGLLWIVFALLVWRPLGMAVHVLWPALFLAAAMAWIQASVWTP